MDERLSTNLAYGNELIFARQNVRWYITFDCTAIPGTVKGILQKPDQTLM